MIFATHIAFLRAEGRPRRWSGAGSLGGLLLMIAIIITTWWTPGLRVTLESGIPWLILLTIAWRFSR